MAIPNISVARNNHLFDKSREKAEKLRQALRRGLNEKRLSDMLSGLRPDGDDDMFRDEDFSGFSVGQLPPGSRILAERTGDILSRGAMYMKKGSGAYDDLQKYAALLLYEAAEAGNESGFTWVLHTLGCPGYVWENPGTDLYLVPADLFITRKPEYLQIMSAYVRPRQEEAEMISCVIGAELCQTDAPDILLAVLDGDENMIRFFQEQGAQLKQDYFEDQVFGKGRRAEYSVEWPNRKLIVPHPGVFLRTGHTSGKRGNGSGCPSPTSLSDTCEEESEKMCKPYRPGWYGAEFHDPLTAAVLSGKKEMVSLIVRQLPEIRWSRSLENGIALSGAEMVAYLLALFPEILRHIRLSAIWDNMNLTLYRAFLRLNREKKEERYQEFAVYLRDCSPDRSKGENVVAFYQMFLSDWRDDEMQVFFQKQLYAQMTEMLDFHVGEQSEAQAAAAVMARTFFELQPGEPADFTEPLFSQDIDGMGGRTLTSYNGRALKELAKHRKQPFLVLDLYHEVLGGDEFVVMKSSDCRTLMNGAAPKEIRAQTDPFNRMLLLKNKIDLVRYAGKRGYITDKNAIALYEFASGIRNCDEEILFWLISKANGASLSQHWNRR